MRTLADMKTLPTKKNVTEKKTLGHRTCKTSLLCSKSVRGANFTKEIPLHEISEKLQILLKKVKGGQFYKRNPSKQIF